MGFMPVATQGKFSCQLISFSYSLSLKKSLSFLSVHVWTLVLGMLMSPDIGRNRLISKICYQIIFFFLSIDVLLKNKNIKIDKKEETNYHYNGTRSKLRQFFFCIFISDYIWLKKNLEDVWGVIKNIHMRRDKIFRI